MSSTAQTYFILVVILLGKISEALNNTELINWQNDDINSFQGTHQKKPLPFHLQKSLYFHSAQIQSYYP